MNENSFAFAVFQKHRILLLTACSIHILLFEMQAHTVVIQLNLVIERNGSNTEIVHFWSHVGKVKMCLSQHYVKVFQLFVYNF